MKLRLIVGTVLVLVGVGIWWFFSDLRSHSTNGENHNHKIAAQKASKYVCPMHPQISSDKPGTCPICGMDLVLVEDKEEHKDHGHEQHEKAMGREEAVDNTGMQEHSNQDMKNVAPMTHSDFSLSLNEQQMIGVKFGVVEKKKLFKSIHAPGRIAFDPELYTAQSEYLEALKQWNNVKGSPLADVRENTKQMIKSSKIRLKVLGLSDDQISQLAKKGTQSEGLLVSGKGQDSWIYADIFEVDLPFLKKGLSAQISANFLQGKILPGKVISVDQVIDPDTRTAKVRIQLLERHPSIRPESYVNVTIFAPVGEHTVVPLEAILDTGRETYVFVKKGEGRFEPRKVTIVFETDFDVAIESGLMPGEKIVVGANFLLDSESRLNAVIQGVRKNSSNHNH